MYVIVAHNGLLKIGCSKQILSRLRTIQSQAPDPLECVAWAVGDRIEESALHARLIGSVHHGEWFSPTPEVLRVVASFRSVVARLRKLHGALDFRARFAAIDRYQKIRNEHRRRNR